MLLLLDIDLKGCLAVWFDPYILQVTLLMPKCVILTVVEFGGNDVENNKIKYSSKVFSTYKIK